jgi:alkylation response protein AidB-like acyl-CoA dehydrogenase
MESVLTAKQKETIAVHAAASESLGQLHPAILALIYEEQWFKLFVPTSYGGPGKKLPEILRLEEALAAVDGSLGWTVTLCSGASWFAGFLAPSLAVELFEDPKVCFAGSGAVGGTAVETDDGYLINGTWQYASGALHATVFTANCTVKAANGDEILGSELKPLVKSFILKKEEVTILPGWSYFGLIATGSHAFEVKNLLVPKHREFEINAELQFNDQGFDYPFLQLAETTLAVNSSGMALHFLTLIKAMFDNRTGIKRYTENQLRHFENVLEQCRQELEDARQQFYFYFDLSWNGLMKDQFIAADLLQAVSLSSRKLAHTARRITDTLFPYAGLAAAKKDSEINRVWRDLHTASQHALLTFED